ncbi:hypothetical protein V2S66_08100 [Streptomyces sp. V4-01]|uniref:Uncharacterized protein n=1 Tax=Actinacidiphila polyblastidii TaxID=3110430 RepID=A0ABU7P7Y4_9ACTN|nr:hypothetical protein [Streptomyces sp. V4-01]
MGRSRTIALTGAVVAVGAAATATVLVLGGGDAHKSSGGAGTDTAQLQRSITRRLPAGWSSRVTAAGGTVDIWLVHQGDMASTIASMRRNKIVNTDDPAIMTLLPPAPRHQDYRFHIADTHDSTDLVRAAVSTAHPAPHPDLQFMSREFVQAQLDELPPVSPTSFTIG